MCTMISPWPTDQPTDWPTNGLTDWPQHSGWSTTESRHNVHVYNLEICKPFSMFVMCSSNMVKQHWVNLFQTKLNDSIEYCKNKAINKLSKTFFLHKNLGGQIILSSEVFQVHSVILLRGKSSLIVIILICYTLDQVVEVWAWLGSLRSVPGQETRFIMSLTQENKLISADNCEMNRTKIEVIAYMDYTVYHILYPLDLVIVDGDQPFGSLIPWIKTNFFSCYL